jgi:thiamine biosynthesis protein ThiS
MNLVVNGESVEIEGRPTVDHLVTTLGVGPRGVAVARNGEVVPRSRWSDEVLVAGDAIEVLEAAQGG